MQSVILTGASSGIGQDLALSLAKRGFRVFAGVRSSKDFQEFSGRHENIFPVKLDVTSDESLKLASTLITPQLRGKVSLINNAGIAVPGPIEAIELSDFEKQFQVNVFGLIRVTQEFLPAIRDTKGSIVNISSVSGLSTSPFLGAYSASKHAVESISDALRRELKVFGVNVIVIEPGPIKTPIWQKGLANKTLVEGSFRQSVYPIYQSAFRRFEATVKDISERALPVDYVTTKIIQALEDKSPPTRIMVASFESWIGTRLSQLLPDKWVDFLISTSVLRKR